MSRVSLDLVKCAECGKVFEKDEIDVEEWDEPRGEYWGMPCSEHMIEWHCPHCGSSDLLEDYFPNDEDEEDE